MSRALLQLATTDSAEWSVGSPWPQPLCEDDRDGGGTACIKIRIAAPDRRVTFTFATLINFGHSLS